MVVFFSLSFIGKTAKVPFKTINPEQAEPLLNTDMSEVLAFVNCQNLSSVSVPASVNTIKARAFTNCKQLQTFSIDENNEYFFVGAVVGNINRKPNKVQGYIAMLAVEEEYRKKGL